MRKKVEPKPTKVSRHKTPYIFQNKAVNLHPLSGHDAPPVTKYQPNTYLMGHTVNMGMEEDQNDRLMSQTLPSHQLQSSSQSLQDDDDHISLGNGLSTDGMGVYEPQQSYMHEPYANDLMLRQAVNHDRNNRVKSAPASLQVNNSHHNIANFKQDRVQNNASPIPVDNTEEDEVFLWLLSEPSSRAQSAKPTTKAPLHSATKRRPLSSIPRESKPIDNSHESFILQWIDKDLINHFDDIDEGVEEEMEVKKEHEYIATNNYTNSNSTGSNNIAVGEGDVTVVDNKNQNEIKEEMHENIENFWSESTKLTSTQSKRHTVSLTRASLLVLIDENKHNTSNSNDNNIVYTKQDSMKFFYNASIKAAAVGLNNIAENLILSNPYTNNNNNNNNNNDNNIDIFSNNSNNNQSFRNPHHNNTTTTNASISHKKAELVDWSGAFQDTDFSEVIFDENKIHRSKSMEMSGKHHINTTTTTGISSKYRTIDDYLLEEGIENVSDTEDCDPDIPFRSIKMKTATRRRSFGDFNSNLSSKHTAIAAIDTAIHNIITNTGTTTITTTTNTNNTSPKYFSYLNYNSKSQKKRHKSSENLKSEELIEAPIDPFEAARPDRRRGSAPSLVSILNNNNNANSHHNIATTGTTNITTNTTTTTSNNHEEYIDMSKNKPAADLLRKYSSPANDGPVWGHIPNLSTKPDPLTALHTSTSHSANHSSSMHNIHNSSGNKLTSRKNSKQVMAPLHSTSHSNIRPKSSNHATTTTTTSTTPVVKGLIKKFSFQGEYLKSPFLYHMTKEKHLVKYGDAQKQQRLSMHTTTNSNTTVNINNATNTASSINTTANSNINTKSILKSNTIKISPSKTTITTTTTNSADISILDNRANNFQDVNKFDTNIEKPKNPFIKQNSWVREQNSNKIDLDIINNTKNKKPFILSRQNTNESSLYGFTNSTTEDNNNNNMTPGMSKTGKFTLTRQNTENDSELFSSGFLEDSRPNSRNGYENITTNNTSNNGSISYYSSTPLSKQDSNSRFSLSRQNSSYESIHPSLSRQNSTSLLTHTLPSIHNDTTTATKPVSDLQALINSINSVLVAPIPLKHSRPADVFTRGASGIIDTSSPLTKTAAVHNGENESGNNRSSPLLSRSRANSFKTPISTPQKTPRTGRSTTSSVVSPGEGISTATPTTAVLAHNPTTTEEGRPLSRPGGTATVTFAPQISDAVMKYVPSERRGSLSSDSLGDLGALGTIGALDTVNIIHARKQSRAALFENRTTSNIDMLVTARRASAMGLPHSSKGGLSPMKPTTTSSIDSTFSNPLMDEYYDAEEGLQDTGVIIANLHADPLYRILQEEIEKHEYLSKQTVLSKFDTLNSYNTTHTNTITTTATIAMLQNHTNNSNNNTNTHTRNKIVLPPRPTRSATTGLSNYKTRNLGPVITPSDLKVLGTFHSLPPAAWVVCRVVYFIIIAFYECVPRVQRYYEYKSYMNIDLLFTEIEIQMTEHKLCMEDLEYYYSWLLLQKLLNKYPIQLGKLLHIIENGIPESDGSNNTPECPCFLPNIFYDIFPPTKLIYLRDLIKQSMGLYQSQELLLVIPVCSQLCEWSKRIISQIYASCIRRLRDTQSATKNLSSVIHSIVTPYIPSDNHDSDRPVWDRKEPSTATTSVLPPSVKFVLAIEDAMDRSALIGYHSLDSYTALEQAAYTPNMTISHTLEKGLNLVRPSDHLDLLLVPPVLSEVMDQLSTSNAGLGGSIGGGVGFTTGDSLDEYSSQALAAGLGIDPDPVRRVQNEWLAVKNNYERHLQHYSASPLHRVVLVPSVNLPTTTTTTVPHNAPVHTPYSSSISSQQQQERELQQRFNDFFAEQSPGHVHGLSHSDIPYPMQTQGIHPVVEHCIASCTPATAGGGSSTMGGFLSGGSRERHHTSSTESKARDEADVLIVRLRDRHSSSSGTPYLTDIVNKEDSLSVRFSLVLVDDRAPVLRRPLSPFSSSLLALRDRAQRSIEQAVASTVGPNRFVVSIADTPNSWLAFQMICRIAKPCDSITLLHIPVIYPPFGAKVVTEIDTDTHRNTDRNAYFTLQEYKKQYERCIRRIEHLQSVYKSIGFNLYIDTIPTYQEEMHRQLIYIQRKNYFHSLILQKKKEIRKISINPTILSQLPASISMKITKNNQNISDKLSSTEVNIPYETTISDTNENNIEINIAIRLFVQNQHTYHLSNRILNVTSKLEASFLVLGCENMNIIHALGVNTPTLPADGCKNLDFPFDHVVEKNYLSHEILDNLMSVCKTNSFAHSTTAATTTTAADVNKWIDGFLLYSDTRIDITEMLLHQYNSYQQQQQQYKEEEGGIQYYNNSNNMNKNNNAKKKELNRFSFILCNSDNFK